MDMKENERVIVAKPIASRPTSSFKSVSDLLAGPFDASSHTKSSEAAVSAIRPKTVKLSSMTNRASPNFSSSQAEISETAPCIMCNKIPQSRSKEFVIHKPLAKLVSRATISLLENMDNLSISQQQPQRPTEAYFKHSIEDKCILRQQPSSYLRQRITSEKKSNQDGTPSDRAVQSPMENIKLPPSSNSDRPSYDGYNWRKYGQKQVKGSEYPRSYYRCTQPSCPVKKKVERSFDGTIAEIVYKGEHNHSKPQPPTRTASVSEGARTMPGGVDQDMNHLLSLSNHLCQKNDSSEGGEKNRIENASIFQCSHQDKDPMQYDSLPALSSMAGAETSEHACGLSGEYEEGSKKFDALEDEPERKRRKRRNQLCEVGPSSDVFLEASVVQNSADSELLEDGFRWRKYGQKLVKGNPYPRSYYRCTDIKCSARKHVERSADDPQAFLTTYEGKHNHEMPLRSHKTVASG